MQGLFSKDFQNNLNYNFILYNTHFTSELNKVHIFNDGIEKFQEIDDKKSCLNFLKILGNAIEYISSKF